MAKKVILAGGRGFLGQVVGATLAQDGWEVVVLTRHPREGAAPREVPWNGETGGAWTAELEGADALVNFAGRSINCVHTLAHSREIVDSRLASIAALRQGWSRARRPPGVWVQCSAVGIYGNAGDRLCTETLEPGQGFLAEVCRRWEEAFQALELPGTRRVVVRLGVVLDGHAGMLPAVARLARRYLGGAAGNGRQFISWIHRDDLVQVFRAALDRPAMTGVYNVCSPGTVTNAEFMRELREVLQKPWAPPAPEFAVRWVAERFLKTDGSLILHGQRAEPRRLQETGFIFQHPQLRDALEDLLAEEPVAT